MVDGTEYTTVTVIVTRYGYTVDDVERFVAVQGVDATDTDGDTATRSTGVLRYLYTGGASLQSLVERGDYGFFSSSPVTLTTEPVKSLRFIVP